MHTIIFKLFIAVQFSNCSNLKFQISNSLLPFNIQISNSLLPSNIQISNSLLPVHTCMHVNTSKHTYTHTFMHTYYQTYIHAQTNIHTYYQTYIHAQTCNSILIEPCIHIRFPNKLDNSKNKLLCILFRSFQYVLRVFLHDLVEIYGYFERDFYLFLDLFKSFHSVLRVFLHDLVEIYRDFKRDIYLFHDIFFAYVSYKSAQSTLRLNQLGTKQYQAPFLGKQYQRSRSRSRSRSQSRSRSRSQSRSWSDTKEAKLLRKRLCPTNGQGANQMLIRDA